MPLKAIRNSIAVCLGLAIVSVLHAASAPPEFHQEPEAGAVRFKSTMRAENPWITNALQDRTFVTRHHIPYSRVDMSQANKPNQVGVGIELSGSERFLNFGELNWRRHPSGHYAAVIAYTVEQGTALRIALNLVDFPERLTVKFVSSNQTGPYPETSLDYAEALGYLNKEVSVHWSPVFSGDTFYIELNYPDIAEAGFDTRRIELPGISFIYAQGPWDLGTQRKPAPASSADKEFVTAKARVDKTCITDVSCRTPGISDTAKTNFSRATGFLLITKEGEPGPFNPFTSISCTGHLIADTDSSTVKPYLLTANHCIATPTEAATVIAYWDYRSASCGEDVQRNNYPNTQNAELLATQLSTRGDWTLLILGSDSEPAVLPGSRYFLGWDSSSPQLGETLHHIGHSAGNPQSYVRGTVVPGPNQQVLFGFGQIQVLWQTGFNAEGSSGSVLVRIDGDDNLYARTGGLSGGGLSNACEILTGSGGRRGYSGGTVLSSFASVYLQNDVFSRLGFGQRQADGTQQQRGAGTDGDVVVILASEASVIEGNSGDTNSLVFNLLRSGSTAQALPFGWNTLMLSGGVLNPDGFATSGSDFDEVALTRGTFPAGERTTALTVTVRGDGEAEPDEVVAIKIFDHRGGGPLSAALPRLVEILEGHIRDDDDDHGNTRADATSLNMDNPVASVSGQIEYESDIDYFRVTVPANPGFRFLTAYTTGTRVTTSGALEDDSGIQLEFGKNVTEFSGHTNFRIEQNVDPGDYYIRVGSQRGLGGRRPLGPYNLNVSLQNSNDDHGNSRTAATRLDLSSGETSIAGTINPANDADVFQFTLSAATRVTAYTSGNLDTLGRLKGSDGLSLAFDDRGGMGLNFSIEYDATPGTYYIQVVNALELMTGGYTLHVMVNNAAQPPPATVSICDRTDEVETAILAAINAVEEPDIACGDVTAIHLAAVNPVGGLSISGTDFRTLEAGDFAGLTALETLTLTDNPNLGDDPLPADLFNGLDALTTLLLNNNVRLRPGGLPGGIFDDVLDTLTTLDLDGQLRGTITFAAATPSTNIAPNGSVNLTVELSTAIAVAMRVPYAAAFTGAATAAHFTGENGTLDFPAGNNTPQTITVTADDNTPRNGSTVIITLSAPTPGIIAGNTFTAITHATETDGVVPAAILGEIVAVDADHDRRILTIPTNICDRTDEVETAILAAIGNGVTCDTVTTGQLAGVNPDGGLAISGTGLRNLKAGDFADLTTLTSLDLSGNTLLTDLPAGIFDDVLDTLTVLNIDDRLKGNLSFAGPSGILQGGTTGITVRSSPAFVAVNTTINVTFSDESAADFGGLSTQSLTFGGDETSITITVTASTTAAIGATAAFAFGGITLRDGDGRPSPLPADSLVVPAAPPAATHTLTVTFTQAEVALAVTSEAGDDATIVEVDTGNGPDDTATITLTVRNVPVETTAIEVAYSLEINGASTAITDIAVVGANIGTGRIMLTSFDRDNATAGATVTITANNDDDATSETVTFTVTGLLFANADFANRPELSSSVTITIDDDDDICSRTQQVQEAILTAIGGGITCFNIAMEHFSAVTRTLTVTGISSLRTGDFDRLTALEGLDLSNNGLTTLPDGVFNGLNALTTLNLSGNTDLAIPIGALDPVLDTLTTLRLGEALRGGIAFAHNLSNVLENTTATISVTRTLPYTTVTVAVGVSGDQASHVTVPDRITLPAGATGATFDVMVAGTALPGSAAILTLGTPALTADTRAPPNADIVGAIVAVNSSSATHTVNVTFTRAEIALAVTSEAGDDAIIVETDNDDGTDDTATITLAVRNVPIKATAIEIAYSLEINGASTAITDIAVVGANVGTGRIMLTSFDRDNATANTTVAITARNDDDTDDETVIFTVTGLSFMGAAFADRPELSSSAAITVDDNDGGICLRTQQVQEAILTAIGGGISCANALPYLSGVSTLTVTGISSLRTGDFDRLTALEGLDLSNNGLTTLPDGVFNGLNALTTLNLSGNTDLAIPIGALDPVLDTLTTLHLGEALRSRIAFAHNLSNVLENTTATISVTRTLPYTTVTVAVGVSGDQASHVTVPDRITLPAGAAGATFDVMVAGTALPGSAAILTLSTPALTADTRAPPNADIVGAIVAVNSSSATHTVNVTFTRAEIALAVTSEAGDDAIIVETDNGDGADDTATITLAVRNVPIKATAIEVAYSLEINGASTAITDIAVVGANVGTGRIMLTSFDRDNATANTTVAITARNDDDTDDETVIFTVTGLSFMGAAFADRPELSSSAVITVDDNDGGICLRTQQVQEAILTAIGGGISCANALPYLSGVSTLTVTGISSLRTGDFDGLGNLRTLTLSGDNNLAGLPAGIFDGVLDTLTELSLDARIKGTASFAAGSVSVRQGGQTTINVVLNQAVPVAMRIPITVAQADGVSVTDAVIPAGTTSTSVTITALANAAATTSGMLSLSTPALLLTPESGEPTVAVTRAGTDEQRDQVLGQIVALDRDNDESTLTVEERALRLRIRTFLEGALQ